VPTDTIRMGPPHQLADALLCMPWFCLMSDDH